MNSINNSSAEAPAGAINYSHVLSAKETQTGPPLSLVRTKSFRIPSVLPKHGARQKTTEPDRPARVSLRFSADETPSEGTILSKEPLPESFDLFREQLLQRSQAKTVVLEEALQRSEWSQCRFWGINE